MQYFYTNVEVQSDSGRMFIEQLQKYAEEKEVQIYFLQHPLINSKYAYETKDVGIVLMREHKISFVSFNKDLEEDFEDYRADVLEDLGSLSDTYNYRKLIGRVRTWENNIVVSSCSEDIDDIPNWIENTIKINDTSQYRRIELIITLFIGSINNIKDKTLDISDNVIENVRQKIQLFDSEQTQFIYDNFEGRKSVVVQGLSGTGKTELLLHKLREIYVSQPILPIGFTCHNRILANELKKRIPEFFNFMMVNKQIDWDKMLCVNAWGRHSNEKSGIYRYICAHYDINFLNYMECDDFDKVCKIAIEDIKNKREENDFAFSYILIDESQDFKDSFFELCELVTEKKVYIAGDIFQNIFEVNTNSSIVPAVLLKNCYRTSPTTLMIAHALGLGLYEKQKLWWLDEDQWRQCGYNAEYIDNHLTLHRFPLRRFDNDNDNIKCFGIYKSKKITDGILRLINEIRKDFLGIKPDDIGIIFIDHENYIYDVAPWLSYGIRKTFRWDTNIAYESKCTIQGTLLISNRNNVKGLEFPIVICVTKQINSSVSYRNTLYTMLTRSFVRSYLLIEDNENNGLTDDIKNGIENTLENNEITTTLPTDEEKEEMKRWYKKAKQEKAETQEERIERILNEQGIRNVKERQHIKEVLNFNKLQDDELTKMLKAYAH